MSKNNGGRAPNLGLVGGANVPIIEARPEAPSRNLHEEASPHPWDELKPTKAWVLVEQVSTEEKTIGGVIIPDASQLKHWQVRAVGPLVTDVQPGQFVLMPAGIPITTYEGRSFAMLWHGDTQQFTQIPGILPTPDAARTKVNPASTLIEDGAS